MNLNQLKYFVMVAEARSFTRAAEQFGVSQTAITQQIRALEDAVGCSLVNRNTRPVLLTPAGSVFLIEAKAILERMDKAMSRTREASTGLVGTLRIGYTKGYERSGLSDILRAFHREFPNVLVSCYRGSTEELDSGLLSGEYDLIICRDAAGFCSDPNVGSKLLERVPLMTVLYAAHPFAQRTALTRAELRGENILYMSASGEGDPIGESYYLELYREAGYQPNIIFRSADAESILMMVAAEEGITILPDYYTRKLTNADNLVFVPLEGENETEEIRAIWRGDNANPALKQMIERM